MQWWTAFHWNNTVLLHIWNAQSLKDLLKMCLYRVYNMKHKLVMEKFTEITDLTHTPDWECTNIFGTFFFTKCVTCSTDGEHSDSLKQYPPHSCAQLGSYQLPLSPCLRDVIIRSTERWTGCQWTTVSGFTHTAATLTNLFCTFFFTEFIACSEWGI